MIWKKENTLTIGYQNKEAVKNNLPVATISTEYRQPLNSKGKYFKAYFQFRQADFRTLAEAKQSVERSFYQN
jgi:hypothetical protein